mgnify:CR=1 FL=1
MTNQHRGARSGADDVQMLRDMLLIRQLEDTALKLSRSEPPRVVGSVHMCAGQEAVPVGAVAGLNQDDQVVATYRGHGWAIASGLQPLQVLGEICHSSIGINGGRGGSAYMMAPWSRFIGENSIVGAGVPIGCGVALANQAARNGRVVVVSIGDGAMNQGATHEGLAFAAAKRLPLLVICENNGWSEMTATKDVFRVEKLSDRAAGYGIVGVTIDGIDPRTVRDTVSRLAAQARDGGGPALIECRVPRLWGHYNRDIEHYRSVSDRQAAAARDPIAHFSRQLIAEGAITEEGMEKLKQEVSETLARILEDINRAPPPDPASARDHVYSSATPARQQTSVTSLPQGEAETMTYIKAVNEALRRELKSRPNVLVYGEDVGKAGGIFGAARLLQKEFGAERVFDTPISESAILGSAVGAAMTGLKPIVEIMWADFMLVALDQLVNQAANIRYITAGRAGAPIVVRTQQGVTPGSCAQHSQSLEALLLHVPGLRVAVPATPQDAYSLLRAAVASDDPCIVIESRSLYQTSGPVMLSDTVEPIGQARLCRSGTQAAIVTWGTMVPVALETAEILGKEGIDVAVLDLRWLSPLDEQALVDVALAAGGRVVVLHEANVTGGFGAEIASRLHEKLQGKVQPRIRRVGTPDVRMPAAPVLQQELVPNVRRVAEAVRGLLASERGARDR